MLLFFKKKETVNYDTEKKLKKKKKKKKKLPTVQCYWEDMNLLMNKKYPLYNYESQEDIACVENNYIRCA